MRRVSSSSWSGIVCQSSCFSTKNTGCSTRLNWLHSRTAHQNNSRTAVYDHDHDHDHEHEKEQEQEQEQQ